MQHNFDKEIELFMTFDILGDTLRTGPLLWYIDRKILEDIKDHAMDLIFIFERLEKHFPIKLDKDKVLNYCIYHDLPEALTGDITKFQGVSSEERKRVTDLAEKYLIEKFKDIIDFKTIFHNYNNRIDIEAKIVHMIDKVHSSTTFIKYQSEKPVNMNDSRIIKDLRNNPFVVEKINEGKDLADTFFEFHLMAVNITDEECEKYHITRSEADTIVDTIKSFATTMYNQKINNTLLNFDKDFPEATLKYNSKYNKDNYHKLVRDNIPNIIEANGEEPIYHTLNDEEYWDALLKKDTEELEEVKEAESKDEILKELGDKLEILRAMAEYLGFTLEDVIKQADKKRQTNGGFQKRLFLETVKKDY